MALAASALAQYDPDGVLADSPDRCPGGKALINPGGSVAAYAIDLRGDGQVAAAGCAVGGGTLWAQLPITGSNLSPLIGTTNFVGDECAHSVKFVGSNKIIAAGFQIFNDDFNISLARFETTVDATVPVVYPLFLPLVMHQP